MVLYTIYGKNTGIIQDSLSNIMNNLFTHRYCIGYVRQSTPKQKSIDEQIHEITKKAYSDNFKFVIIFQVTGSSWNPTKISKLTDFKDMLKLIENISKYVQKQRVYIYDVSRFMRNVLMASKFINEVFDPYNCEIYSIIDNKIWDKNNSNRIDFLRELVNAEASSTLLSNKIKNNISLRRTNGHYIGGVKFGYERYRRKGIRKIRKNAHEQKILGYLKLKKMEKKHYGKKYLSSICKKLNHKRLYKRNMEWNEDMVKRIFNSNLKNVKIYDFEDKDELDNWIQCNSCKKWRKVNKKYYDKFENNTFVCEDISCFNCNIPEEEYSDEGENSDMDVSEPSTDEIDDICNSTDKILKL